MASTSIPSRQPALTVEPVEPAGVEGCSQKPACVRRVGNLSTSAFLERPEPGEPAGVHRAIRKPGWAVEEADALTCHGVLVAAPAV